jgi:GNAT superfamily N-acetyltransferase
MLRDFEPRDQDVVRELILAGLAERWGDRFDPNANPDTDDLWGSYVVRGGEIVVFELESEVVATGTLIREAHGAGRILRMSVDHRHRRKGLARIVVGELIERASRRGLDPVRVETDTPWAEAVALYATCGFALVSQDAIASHFVMTLGVR